MKEKLFKMMFPKKYNLLRNMERDISGLEENMRLNEEEKPSMADLMRDNLGLSMINFANVDIEGYPVHFLEGLTSQEKKIKLAELSNCFKSDALQSVFDYWINNFGNHSVRHAGPDQMEAGRFGINGVMMIRNELKKSHAEFMASNKSSKSTFDDQDIGVPLEI